MLDQARFRHQQHRTKFKEAIDYLDQIFEDLKKECDPAAVEATRRPPQKFPSQDGEVHLRQAQTIFMAQQKRAQLQKSASQDAGNAL